MANDALLNLQYSDASQAAKDANFVMTADGSVIEIQPTSEEKPLPGDEFMKLKVLAEQGIKTLSELQLEAINGAA